MTHFVNGVKLSKNQNILLYAELAIVKVRDHCTQVILYCSRGSTQESIERFSSAAQST